MSPSSGTPNTNGAATLILGGTGKTGRRVVARLEAKGITPRIGARSAQPSFDWHDSAGWDAVLEGIRAAYVSFAPDLAIPGACDTLGTFLDRARQHGVQRLVLLSGRGEAEALAAERLVQASGLDWTIVRASWFNQNFSEGAFRDMVLAGAIALPGGGVPEPFVDADDIADVAVAALTEAGHAGQLYEVTGPRLLTFADVAAELGRASRREIAYLPVSHASFVAAVERSGAPDDVVWLLDYLLATVLDGRNAYLADGVERALGRPPKDFATFAHEAAAAGVWTVAA
jgi:uncharacterized protein YbjT (DUF2867 family)